MSLWATVLDEAAKEEAKESLEREQQAVVDEIVARVGRGKDAVVPILQAIQEEFRWLPEPALWRVCATTKITPATLWGVATFYDQFRHKTVGKHIVHICHGTACHVTGADRVEDALRRELGIPRGNDTDAQGEYTIESVACLGCCTLSPVLKFDRATYGHVSAEKLPGVISYFQELARNGHGQAFTEQEHGDAHERAGVIKVGLGSCCMAKGSDRLFVALKAAARETGADVQVKRVGCVGICHRTPLVEISAPGKSPKFFEALDPAEARSVVLGQFRSRNLFRQAAAFGTKMLDRWLLDDRGDVVARHALNIRDPAVDAFLGRQVHIATEHFGKLDPLDLDEYLANEGFKALRRCLVSEVRVAPYPGEGAGPSTQSVVPEANARFTPDQIIDLVTRSGVRGRGGAGFPTGPKWKIVRAQPGDTKYVICNGDEGDPGAFMDRMLLESFPFRIIEGLAIAAVAVGAHEGFFYVRREYPLAVERIRDAIAQMEKRGWLGERLLGTKYPLKFSLKEGAGAFVCGEETALIKSIEGERGMPRLRPPFPAESGLWGKPTVINNVETLALLPWILRNGPEKFAALGTATSKGTKVFALAGKIVRGGLIEVPMGTTLRQIVEEIGGGVAAGRRFKAVQIGGPSGGCIPARLAETPVDYESLREVGAIMGSGGLIVLDDADCMVDIARYFLQFTQNQSCGKCTFCRVGTRRMLDILELLCAGKAHR